MSTTATRMKDLGTLELCLDGCAQDDQCFGFGFDYYAATDDSSRCHFHFEPVVQETGVNVLDFFTYVVDSRECVGRPMPRILKHNFNVTANCPTIQEAP